MARPSTGPHDAQNPHFKDVSSPETLARDFRSYLGCLLDGCLDFHFRGFLWSW